MTRVRSRFALVVIVQLVALLVVLGGDALAQTQTASGGRFVMKSIQDETGTYPYQVFLPKNYSSSRKWPVIVFLHGAGERGVDGKLQTTIGLGPFLEAGVVDPQAVVVFPQAAKERGRLLDHWAADSPATSRMMKILKATESEYSIDETRRILTGWSMGGYGVWSIAAKTPQMWSAIVPIAGGGKAEWGEALSKTPAWIFHGENDPLVPVSEATEMADAVKKSGGNATLTVFPGVGHDSWLVAYANPALYRWMYSPSADVSKIADPKSYQENCVRLPFGAYGSQPFVPGMTVSKAASVMISPSMIAYLSDALTDQLRTNPFRGPVQNINTTTTAEGYSFSVTFSGNSYVASVSKVDVIPNRDGTLTANIALSPLRMTLGRTSIRGVRRQAASTGAISIVVGQRYPVNLGLTVRPQVVDGKFVFQFVGTSFQIPPDNFSVSRPAVTGTSGWGVTADRVSSGIVSGLYGSRGRMEQEVRQVAPTLVRTFEETINSSLDFSKGEDVLAGLWPMPFYQPRARVFPEGVNVSENGIAIRLGGVSGRLAGATQTQPVVATIQGANAPSLASVSPDELLRVNIDTGLFEAFTRQIITSGLNEVNILDVPVESFAEFAKAEYWTGKSEEMKKAFDGKTCQAYIRLADPVVIKPLGSETEYQLGTNGLMMDVYAADSSGAEQLVTSLRIALNQSLKLNLQDTSKGGHDLTMSWEGNPEVKVSVDKGDVTLADDQLQDVRDQFTTGWNDWIDKDKMIEMKAPSIQVGLAKLMMNRVASDNVNLQASFGTGTIRIYNKTDEPFDYQVATKVSPFSRYSLPGGKNHSFTTLYPYRFRRVVDGKEIDYTLPIGGSFEYRVPSSGGEPRLFTAD